MQIFRDSLDFCRLRCNPYLSYKYTWDNRRRDDKNMKFFLVNDDNMKFVLDKGCLNNACVLSFSQALCKHISCLVSDHQCLLFSLKGVEQNMRGVRRFQFNLAWLKEEECEVIILKN